MKQSNIFKAIQSKNLNAVYECLSSRIDPNTENHKGQTAAEYAKSLAGNDPVAKSILHAIELQLFCNIAIEALQMFNIYCQLYEESEEQIKFLNTCSPPFFAHLQHMWHDRTLLDICRFTEEGDDNCSIHYWFKTFFENSKDAIGEKAAAAFCRMLQIRSFAKPARNKIVGHIDKKTMHKNKALGGMPNGATDIADFYKSLECFLSEVSARLYNNPNRPCPLSLPCSEGSMLVKLLRMGMERRKEPFSRRIA